MKLKSDHVTNSSSSSFIILKEHISQRQIDLIFDHIEVGMILAKKEGRSEYPCAWSVSEDETKIEGYTSMDNFDMSWYLEKIGVNTEHIEYDHS